MAKLDRILQKIFGSSGSTAEFGKVGSLADGAAVYTKDLETIQAGAQFLRGLFGLTASGDEPPRIQDINSLYLLFSSQLKYIFQSGIAEYIATEEYYIGSLCQIAGVIYVSQSGAGSSPNVNNPPATDDGTYWLELLDADGLLAKLLTVDGSGSGLDADKVRATTPGTGGLALLALSALGANWATTLGLALGTNWSAALGAALATNVKHVMGAGLGADWQALLEAAANTAVKNNIAAACSGNAATADSADSAGTSLCLSGIHVENSGHNLPGDSSQHWAYIGFDPSGLNYINEGPGGSAVSPSSIVRFIAFRVY
jgi:hypothetical protein